MLKIFFCLKILFLAFTPKQRNGGGNGVPLIHTRQNSSLLTSNHSHSPSLTPTIIHSPQTNRAIPQLIRTHSHPTSIYFLPRRSTHEKIQLFPPTHTHPWHMFTNPKPPKIFFAYAHLTPSLIRNVRLAPSNQNVLRSPIANIYLT